MTDFYSQVVQITQEYLGPAAKRFVDRQIKFHLEREDHNLSPQEVERMGDWISTGVSMLTQNKQDVIKVAQEIKGLVKS